MIAHHVYPPDAGVRTAHALQTMILIPLQRARGRRNQKFGEVRGD